MEKYKKIFIIVLAILYVVSFGGFCYHYFYGDYNDNVYLYENSNTDFTEVCMNLKFEENVYCAVKSAYYKLAMTKDPKEHPFVYERDYDDNGECVALREVIYMDSNFTFDNLGRFLDDVQADSIYVIPLKETKMIDKMKSHIGFHMDVINQYAIFRPIILDKNVDSFA